MRLAAIFAILVAVVTAQYQLVSNYAGETFLDNFIFYDSWDPTYGCEATQQIHRPAYDADSGLDVHYVDRAVAEQFDMISVTSNSTRWSVDTSQILDPDANLGRPSLRLISTQSFTYGLFVLDLAHMPANICGTWPAFWMLGSGLWPQNGEIDIIEYTNDVPNDLMALHTSPGCTVAGANQTGTLVSSDCGESGGITGCSVTSTIPNNSGDAFNANGGGVYLVEWTSRSIRIWFFPREAIPASISAGAPDTSEFGIPAANFYGDCNFDSHFYNMSLLFDVDFCGSYAGNVWQANGCPMLDPTNGWSSCNEWVALNPTVFNESYWEVYSLKVYQLAGAPVPNPVPSTASSVTPAISTSAAASTALSGAQGRSSTPTMSLAGTTPTVTTGSFTATTSVLSVVSSLESSSKISSSTSVQTSPAPPTVASPATATASASSTSTSSSTQTAPSLTGRPPISTMASPSAPTAVGTMVCNDGVCTSYVYATVTQTVTVGARELARRDGYVHAAQDQYHPRRQSRAIAMITQPPGDQVPGELKSLPPFACNFTVDPLRSGTNRETRFACTTEGYAIMGTSILTETITTWRSIHSGRPLKMPPYLTIQTISVTTEGVHSLGAHDKRSFTGSFTPSTESVASTTLTAYPVKAAT